MPKKQTKQNTLGEVLLGIDYGETNIGLAFGFNGLVMPLHIIAGQNDQTAINEISKYALENKVSRLIMGLPLSVDGKETEQSRKVRKFSKLLKIRLKKPLEFVNEFRTTMDSKTEAVHLGISKKRRGSIDDLSAALILRCYYSSFS